MNKIIPSLFLKHPFCDQEHRLCTQYRNASQNPNTMRLQTSNFKEIHSEPVQRNKSKMTDKCRESSRIIGVYLHCILTVDHRCLTALHTLDPSCISRAIITFALHCQNSGDHTSTMKQWSVVQWTSYRLF